MTYIMFAYNMNVPHIAANDDFLNIVLVRWIFKHSGVFFINQNFENDPLYHAIFSEYVLRLMFDGFPLEIFIEGTRSRTGKNMPPKLGLVSLVVDPYLNKEVEDILFVPITINYEKVVEEDNHVRELMGENKQKPSLKKLLKVVFGKILGRSYGRINVQFAEPVLFSQFAEKCKIEHSITNPQINNNEKRVHNPAGDCPNHHHTRSEHRRSLQQNANQEG